MTAVDEVPEDDAPAAIAAGYQHIRDLLGSTFVPTIYRRLALHPKFHVPPRWILMLNCSF